MRSRSNGGVIGAYQLPTQNFANGVFFIHDAAIYNTGNNPIWPLGTGFIYSATGGTIATAADNSNYKTHTFTANGTFTINSGSGYIDALVVGGGGGTDYVYLNSSQTIYLGIGGGGGGTVGLIQNMFVNGPTTFTVTVGAGGASAGGSTVYAVGNNGSPSQFTSNKGHYMMAYGGGKGGGGTGSYLPSSGGSGGGGFSEVIISSGTPFNAVGAVAGSTGSNNTDNPRTTASFYLNSGGMGQYGPAASTSANAGGGGGAGGPGVDGNVATNRSYGGDGFLWSRTGLYYGAGGAGGSYNFVAQSGLYGNSQRQAENATGAAGYGNGAGGAASMVAGGFSGFGGSSGGSGCVIFCYRYQ